MNAQNAGYITPTQPTPSARPQHQQQPQQPVQQPAPILQSSQLLLQPQPLQQVGASLSNWLFGENNDANPPPTPEKPTAPNFLPSPSSPEKSNAKKIANYKDLFWTKIKDKNANEVYNKLTRFVAISSPPVLCLCLWCINSILVLLQSFQSIHRTPVTKDKSYKIRYKM